MAKEIYPYGVENPVESTIGDPVQKTISMQMQGGRLFWTSPGSRPVTNGYTGMEKTNVADFFKSIHSVLMLSLERCSIVNVAVEEGETLTIICYNASGAYTTRVDSVASVPQGTSYVKFMLVKSEAYTSIRNLEVTVYGDPVLKKNRTPELVTRHCFSFETTWTAPFETILNNDGIYNTVEESSQSYVGANNNTRYFDQGYIKLPPNYSQDGAPVPLVVYVHGTGGWSYGTAYGVYPNNTYENLRNFIVNNGYAVCDCLGLTTKHQVTSSNSDDAFFAPSFVSCINDMVKFIYANYNVCDDGVYIYGKSSAGFVVHMLTQQQGLHIKAAGSLAPSLSVISNMHYNACAESPALKVAYQQLGITDWNDDWNGDGLSINWRDEIDEDTADKFTGFKNFILSHIHELRQIDPFFFGADITDNEIRDITGFLYNDQNALFPKEPMEGEPDTRTKRDFAQCSNALAILNSAKLHVNTPTKIWIASDDTNVKYKSAKLYVDMAQRAGSPVYLRRMPTRTGGHSSVDTNTSWESYIKKVTYKPRYSPTEVTVPIAYAELVDWFNRY